MKCIAHSIEWSNLTNRRMNQLIYGKNGFQMFSMCALINGSSKTTTTKKKKWIRRLAHMLINIWLTVVVLEFGRMTWEKKTRTHSTECHILDDNKNYPNCFQKVLSYCQMLRWSSSFANVLVYFIYVCVGCEFAPYICDDIDKLLKSCVSFWWSFSSNYCENDWSIWRTLSTDEQKSKTFIFPRHFSATITHSHIDRCQKSVDGQ